MVIEIDAIKKSFNGKAALLGVNCQVEKGEIFGLLGPSGAGKTTIIKIITGQMKADSGRASLLGRDVNKIDDETYSQIGMVLDDSGLYTRFSCYENLAIFAEIYGVDKSNIVKVLEKVQLADAIKKTVSKLSKGMVQRLVIARAIMHNPKVIFLDEPTSGLDPATAQEIHKLIFELRDQGATIFLTTHNMEEATFLCDNVALLNEGKIVEYGNPREICRKYNTEKKIVILLKDKSKVILSHSKESAKELFNYFTNDEIESIHSSEPNLETVFISLTGRKLV